MTQISLTSIFKWLQNTSDKKNLMLSYSVSFYVSCTSCVVTSDGLLQGAASLLQRVHRDIIITGAGGLANIEKVPLSTEASRAVKKVSRGIDQGQGDRECRRL